MELRLEGLTKQFGSVRAVDDVSFDMKNGVYGLLGVNGAGKTTMMRMICTLLKPTSGKITCSGHDIFEMGGDYRKLLGYLPQDFGYYPDFTVRDYLKYIASIKGIPTAAASRAVDRMLHMTGMEKFQYRKMKKLSGGMKRRAGIAQAVLNDPEILVLDEPTAGLDPKERIHFRNLISELGKERIVLLSTHIVSDVEYIAGKIMIMGSGRIIHSGSVNEILSEVDQRVWYVTVPEHQVSEYMRHYKVVNMRSAGPDARLRILSENRPCGNAEEDRLNLEDVFLYYFGKNEGDDDDTI